MTDTDTSKEPRNWNWFQARLRTKLWTSGALITGLLVIFGVWIGFAFPWWNASQYITKYTPNPEQVLRNLVWLFGSIFGGTIAVLGFVNAIHRTQQKDRELDAAEARLNIEQTSERRKTDAEIFAKSVEQLGHEQMAIRLGGLYSLENLARSAQALPLDTDNKAYLNSLLETLAAFVRMRAPIPHESEQSEDDKIATDIEAAIRIISRTFGYDLRKKVKAEVDLRNCYLPKLKMPGGADMQGFNLGGSVLSSAPLANINLNEAMLWNANLSKANLYKTNLSKARLWNVDLSKAYLYETNLSGTTLANANMTDTKLSFPVTEHQNPNWDSTQFIAGIWNPDNPPTDEFPMLFSFPKDLQAAIDARTKVIRENGLWEEYLAEREKNETS